MEVASFELKRLEFGVRVRIVGLLEFGLNLFRKESYPELWSDHAFSN